MKYEINCSHCNTTNTFDESKLNNNKKAKIIYCSKCSRAITLELNGEKFYDEPLDI